MRVFLASTQSYLVDACKLLASDLHGLYIGSYSYEKTQLSSLPKALALNQLDVNEGLLFDNLSCVHSFKPTAFHYELLKRSNSTSYAVSREGLDRIAAQVYNMWIHFFYVYRPTHIIFEDIPHQFADHILYELCLEKGVTVIGFSPIYGGLGSIVWSDYSKPGVCESLAGKTSRDLTQNYKALTSFNKSKNFDNIKSIKTLLWDHTELQKYFRASSLLKGIYLRLVRIFRVYKYYRSYPTDIWLRNTLNLPLGYIQYEEEMRYSVMTKERNMRFYQSIASDFVCPSMFVILYLQYMPEVSTCPCSYPFTDIGATVETIVQNLPPGFKLLVKEHPSQFSSSYTRYPEAWRTTEFYRSLSLNEKIALVPLDIDSYKLAIRSQCVFTFGGSIGADMINKGIHVCSLGLSWYKTAIRKHHVRSFDELALYTQNVMKNKSVFTESASECLSHLQSILLRSHFCTIGGPKVVKHLKLTSKENTDGFLSLMRSQLGLQR